MLIGSRWTTINLNKEKSNRNKLKPSLWRRLCMFWLLGSLTLVKEEINLHQTACLPSMLERHLTVEMILYWQSLCTRCLQEDSSQPVIRSKGASLAIRGFGAPIGSFVPDFVFFEKNKAQTFPERTSHLTIFNWKNKSNLWWFHFLKVL